MTRHPRSSNVLMVLAAALLGACGGPGESSSPKAAGAAADSTEARATMNPCRLATHAQVTAVLPDADDGMVDASGGSLLAGVDVYQCSYSYIVGTEASLLTVIVSVAANDSAWAALRPGDGSFSDEKRVDVGDKGWVRGTAEEMKVKVLKGRAMIDVELMAPDAEARTLALIELARIVTSNVG